MTHQKALRQASTVSSALGERRAGGVDLSRLAASLGQGFMRPGGAYETSPPMTAAQAVNLDIAVTEPNAAAAPVLSARQFDVLMRIAAGQTSPAIARDLGLSTRTIDHYVADVCKKLGAKSRAQAVATALRLGLISQAQT
ncbi:MAG: LuxR C-terminal-related transcriptional regulator [Pseudomonadota bacterium]